jgi:hypothetical protein
MPNALTGDFEAVLEVSNATIDRLMATMHQNGFIDESMPSLPHVVYFRLGNRDIEDSERGSVAAQVGVPHVVLIDGATDRFQVEFGLRARYRADPGSKPLADIIHGTVRAEYKIHAIDPNCWGWQDIADDYIWLRVVENSVSFDGTVYDESPDLVQISQPDGQAQKARVLHHLRDVLKNQFEPVPQFISKSFRRFRCLAVGASPGQAAVAIPFGLSTETPVGKIQSINNLFLEGRDFGIAISREYILARVEPQLSALVGLQRDFYIPGDAGFAGGLGIDYHVRIDTATAEWLGPLSFPPFSGSVGVIRIHLSGAGWATRLYRSGVFNIGSLKLADLAMTFSIDQMLILGFDSSSERLTLAPLGAPAVSVNYGGPFSSLVKPRVRDTVAERIQANLEAVLGPARMELDSLTAPNRKSALLKQLRRTDKAADVYFDEAAFHEEGLVLRGTIALSYRHTPRVSFQKTSVGDGFDAIESWIPGGRIDHFEWSWKWFTNQIEAAPGPPGSTSLRHDFLLRRPQGPVNRFGLRSIAGKPLPGLDGVGRICLTIRGVQVDHSTGALVPVTSVVECEQFGYEFKLPYEVGPYVLICDPLRRIEGRAREVGVLRVGVPEASESASNTLVLYLGESWNEQAITTLQTGLDECRRVGAGLLVVLLFREGLLEGSESPLRSKVKRLRTRLPAPIFLTKDLSNGWAKALAFPDAPGEFEWRLVTPSGVVCWAHQGHLEPTILSSVLEERLVTSRAPAAEPIRTAIELPAYLPIEFFTQPCPPSPVARPEGSTMIFVQKGRASSRTLLEQLASDISARDSLVVVIVVEGANAGEAQELRSELKLPWLVVPDPQGVITRRAGVRITPTMLYLDEFGRASGIEAGVELGSGRAAASQVRPA